MLDFLDPFNLKQYFNRFNALRDFTSEARNDFEFLSVMRRSFFPIPFIDSEVNLDTKIFPPFRPDPIPFFKGKKIGLIASGGSGALVTLCGVYRALEEAGIEISAISVCSGSAVWGALIASGLSAQEITEFALSLKHEDYLDLDWSRLLRSIARGGRQFSGLLKGEAVEKTFLKKLGPLKLSQTPIHYYTIVFNMDLGQVEYLGSGLKPDVTLAKSVRVSIALPLFFESVEIGGHLYNDGGVIDIFPVDPLLEYEKDLDFFIGLNCIFPKNFVSENITGWRDKTLGILDASQQLRYANWQDLARRNLKKLGDDVLLLHPIPFTEIRGANFYRIFVERERWPSLIQSAYEYTWQKLEAYR